MKKLAKIIFNIFRGVCRVTGFFLITIAILLIKALTFEPGTNRQITPRKARRIRFLSKVKLIFFNTVPDQVLSFLGILSYKEKINLLKDGLQLRYQQTDKRIVPQVR